MKSIHVLRPTKPGYYRKELPPKMYGVGIVILFIQYLCSFHALSFEVNILWSGLSVVSVMIGHLILLYLSEGNYVCEKWKAKVMGDAVCLLSLQLILAITGPVL